MQSIEYNIKNHQILNQTQDILVELLAQNKKIIPCKVTTCIRIKGNKEADKAAKQAIDMQRMTTTKLPYTEYYLTTRRATNSEWQREWKITLHQTMH